MSVSAADLEPQSNEKLVKGVLDHESIIPYTIYAMLCEDFGKHLKGFDNELSGLEGTNEVRGSDPTCCDFEVGNLSGYLLERRGFDTWISYLRGQITASRSI